MYFLFHTYECKAEFLKFSVLHDPSEIILICCFGAEEEVFIIIIIIISCAVQYVFVKTMIHNFF